MKKTILGVVTIAMILIFALSTTVNAATLSVVDNKTEVEKGEIVTIQISTNEPVKTMQFDLKYDTAKYKYVENSIKTDLAEPVYKVEGDTIKVSVLSVNKTTNTLTVQFEALTTGENIPFEISNAQFLLADGASRETMDNSSVEVTITEKQEEVPPTTEPENPTTPEDPTTEPENPTTPEDPSTEPENPTTPEDPATEPENPTTPEQPSNGNGDGEKYYDEDGNEITKIPQAGSVIPSIILGVAILGIAMAIVFKMIKNK